MKTKIGLPLGLALVMFIGIFTTMLALGALNPQPAEAVTAGFDVTLTNYTVGEETGVSFTFESSKGIADTNTITFTFPTGFGLTGDAVSVGTNWTVAGFPLAADGVAVAGANNLIVTLTAGVDNVVDDPGMDTANIAVVFTDPAGNVVGQVGIVNPSAPAEGVTLTNVRTSQDSTVAASAAFDIAWAVSSGFTVTVDKPLPGVASGYRFAVTAGAVFAAEETLTITFPPGTGLPAASVEDKANWTLGTVDPESVTVDTTTDPNAPTVTLKAPVGFTAITAGEDIDVVASESAGIANPPAGTGITFSVGTSSAPIAGQSLGFSIVHDPTVDDLTVTQDPISPGAQARYQIKFITAYPLDEGTDEIILDLDSTMGVPTSLQLQDVRISASAVTNQVSASNPTGSTPNQNRSLEDAPRYRVLAGTDNRKEYRISIPDMDSSPDRNASIAAGATVTLTLQANAGFTNPTESNNEWINVSTSRQTDPVRGTFYTPVVLFSDDRSDNRDKPLTVTGQGFKNGTSVTVYLDKNKDGEKNTGDVDLVTVLVASDDTFEATFNVTVPPFEPLPMRNVINATDGESPANTLSWDVDEIPENQTAVQLAEIDAARLKIATDAGAPAFEVEGLISVSPKTLGVGDTLNIDLKDWPNYNIHEDNAYLSIGGVFHTDILKNAPGSISNNRAQFEVDIKNDVRLGTQQVEFGSCAVAYDPADTTTCPSGSLNEVDNTTVVITGADLIVRPDTVVANQTITVTGRGFTSGARINGPSDASSVTLDTNPMGLKAEGGPRSNRINDNETVDVDNGGNWSASIVVPVSNASINEGPHELKIIDTDSREGVAIVTIVPRTLTLEPGESRVGTRVTVTGTGFPARNTEGEPVRSVEVEYNVGGTRQWEQVGSVSPDGSGNFSVSFLVPTDAGIPSTNSVRAVFNYGFGDIITLTTHTVPEGTITLSDSEASAGEEITITGQGFKAFRSVNIIEIGEAEITPSPKPLTTANGEFTARFIVPGLDPGIKNVKAEIDETTASAPLTIVAAPEPGTMPEVMMNEAMAPAMAFAPVVAEDNLVKVFHFDPATQNEAPNYGWTIYDARPLFMATNTLDTITPGGFYFLQVTNNQMGVEIGGTTMDLYAGLNPVQW